ncbi:MAG: glycosyltransferase family 4 protein [Acidimicrobiales bacterium]
MTHLLVTNDFPPKVGGIQTYLWELWRRLPPDSFRVLTTAHPDASAWDRSQPFQVDRVDHKVLVPTPDMVARIDAAARDAGAGLVVLDPALPIGLVGRRLATRYAVVLHGAEITVPGRVPVLRPLLAGVLRGATGIVAAGGYPEAEARHAVGEAGLPEVVRVPPGVDPDRFAPMEPCARTDARAALGLPTDGPLVVSASRLVPRKGMDVLIEAAPRLVAHRPALQIAIAGTGRDARRLHTLAGRQGLSRRVHFLGRLPDAQLPHLYAAADVFVMLCRNRWSGLEQEGYGIVFLEAAACGVPQIAGDSGGAAEAVLDGVTGIVVRDPQDAEEAATAIARLLDDEELRSGMGHAARQRVVDELAWDHLALRLHAALTRWSR